MPEQNVRLNGGEIARWVVLALVLAACLAAYFLYAPSVPPVVRPQAAAEAS
jgi:hypothetical protein